MIYALLALRALTTRLRHIPGAVFVLEPLRRWYCRAPRSIVVPDFDGTLLQVRLDEHMGSQIFWYGSYSREVLEVLDRILRPGMVVLDVGANIGEVSLYAAKRVTAGGQVICFEMFPDLAAILRANAARNGLTWVDVAEIGIADAVGWAPAFNPSDRFRDGALHAGLGTIFGQEGRHIPAGTVPLTTIDQFLESHGVDAVDLIKVDVEGAELPALRGATATLRRCHPWLVLEVQRETSLAAGYDQQEILAFLEAFGYRFARIGRRGKLEPLSAMTLRDFQNVLCIPGGAQLPAA
jgi:FkbM family methyltransferase